MGGAPAPRDERRRAPRPDPIPIPREALREHLADLDEACESLRSTADPRARRLLQDVLASLPAVVFDPLPPGEGPAGSAGHAA